MHVAELIFATAPVFGDVSSASPWATVASFEPHPTFRRFALLLLVALSISVFLLAVL